MTPRTFLTPLVAALLAAGAASAQAADNGWMINGGFTWLSPNTKSDTLTAPAPRGTTVDVGDDTEPTFAITRQLDEHWSVEIPLGFGFEHSIYGSGAIAGVGKVASVKVLPATVFVQYRFGEQGATVRPYVMLGATYAFFYGEKGSATLDALNPVNPAGGTGLKVDSRFAATPGIGVSVELGKRWYLDAQYAHSFLTTTTTLSSGQTIRTKLDPDMVKIGIGLHF